MNKDREIFQSAINAGFSEDCARLVVAQARHETGNYTSTLCKRYNNYFGMRPAQKRKTTRLQIITPGNYASYKDLGNSVMDLAEWFSYNRLSKDISSVVAYVQALRQNKYFEASEAEYLNGVKRALKKLSL